MTLIQIEKNFSAWKRDLFWKFSPYFWQLFPKRISTLKPRGSSRPQKRLLTTKYYERQFHTKGSRHNMGSSFGEVNVKRRKCKLWPNLHFLQHNLWDRSTKIARKQLMEIKCVEDLCPFPVRKDWKLNFGCKNINSGTYWKNYFTARGIQNYRNGLFSSKFSPFDNIFQKKRTWTLKLRITTLRVWNYFET